MMEREKKVYLWWSLCTLYLHACQVRVTVGGSGLCRCTCVTSLERYLTPLCVDPSRMVMLMKVKPTMLQKNGAGGANQRRLAHAEVCGADRAGADAVCRVAHEHLAGLLPGSHLRPRHHGHQTHRQHVSVHSTLIFCYSSLTEGICGCTLAIKPTNTNLFLPH